MIPIDALLALLPPTLLDRLALQSVVNAVNQTRLTGQVMFVCLLHLLAGHPKVTQRMLEEAHSKLRGRTADHSSFGKRLQVINPDYFAAIYRHVYREVAPRMRFGDEDALRLRRADATTVVLSAKLTSFGIYVQSGGKIGPDHAKRHVKTVFELSEAGFPSFLRLCRKQAEANDNPAIGDAMIESTQPGDLWVVDAGVFDRHRLWAIDQKGGFFLVPHHGQKLRVLATVWEAASSPPMAGELMGPRGVAPGVSKKRNPPPCRLVRVEHALFENSVDAKSPTKQEQWAQMPLVVLHCERWDVRTQHWQPWTLLINLPLSADGEHAGPFTFVELTELYRRRWAIELFFKFLKQYLSYAHLTSRCENGIQVMIWMALILAVLLIWYQGATGIDRGWRSVKFWFAEDAGEWTWCWRREAMRERIGYESG